MISKKIISIFIIIIILIVFICLSIVAQTDVTLTAQAVKKDETIYCNLEENGSIASMYQVNRILVDNRGIYEDFGDYLTIVNLSGNEEPLISGDSIKWTLENTEIKNFYYQGNLRNGELPFTFVFSYQLDGKTVKPLDIIGSSGKIKINLSVRTNPRAAQYFRKNYICQIQLPINLDKCSNIFAPKASQVVFGHKANLVYMLMPETNKDFTLEFDTTYFEMDSMMITCSKYDLTSFVNIDLNTDEIKTTVTQMSEGTKGLIDDTLGLKNSLNQISTSFASLSNISTNSESGMVGLYTDLKKYIGGVDTLAANANDLSLSAGDLSSGGANLSADYTGLSEHISSLATAINDILPTLTPEQQGQLGPLIAVLTVSQQSLETELNNYIKAVGDVAKTLPGIAPSIRRAATGGAALNTAAKNINSGLSGLNSGVKSAASLVKVMPAEVQKLLDEQTVLNGEIDQITTFFNNFNLNLNVGNTNLSVVSFVSNKIVPLSVQFILKTPSATFSAVKIPPTEVIIEKTFWDRLMNLFK